MNRIHPKLREEEILWQLILNNVCTLQELETTYTLDDVMRANAMLNAKIEIENICAEQEEK